MDEPEGKTGQSVEEPKVPPTQTEETGTQGTTEPTTPPEIPEKFQGKTAEDIAKSYVELESKLGQTASQNDQLARRLQMLEESVQRPQQPQPPQDTTSAYEDMFMSDPLKATQRMIQDNLSKYETQARYRQAYSASEFAKMTAKMQHPDLFKQVEEAGLTQSVDQMIHGGVRAGVVQPEVATSPDGWAMAAWQTLGQKQGFKIPTALAPKQTASQPIETGVPMQGKRTDQSSPVRIPPEWGDAWDKMGLSKKDQEDIVRKQTGGE